MLSRERSAPFRAIRIAGRALDAHDGHDIAGGGRVDIFFLIGVHAEDPADPRSLPLARVEVKGSLGERALIDADESHLPKRLFHEFESHGDQRARRDRRQRNFGPAIGVVFGEDLAVERARQIPANGIKQGLNALVAIGGADHHRAELLRDRSLADGLVNQVDRDFGFFEKETP